MKCPPPLADESDRQAALAAYGLGSTRPLPSLDPVVQLLTRIFDVPVAAVNLIGSDHVFFAAATGWEGLPVDMGRDVSFCAHAITRDGVMIVPDARLDERFHDNPLVTGPTSLRFYAGVPLSSPEGQPLGALCVIDTRPRDFDAEEIERLKALARMAADRLELRRLEISTEQRRRPFEEFARNSPTAVVWFDQDGQLVAWNAAAARLHGYREDEGAGRPVTDLVAPAQQGLVEALIRRAAAAGTCDGLDLPDRLTGRRADGSEFVMGLSFFCWREGGRVTFNAHLEDLTEVQRRDAELQRMATTDMLTGLANRAAFYRSTEQCLLASGSAGLVMIDLDGFKDINDTLGHPTGDEVLKVVATRLQRLAGPQAQVARIGGDEFAVLLPGVTELRDAEATAERLLDGLAEPVEVGPHEIRLAASGGVALAPDHAREALELIGNADLALFRAKAIGRGRHVVFVTALRMEAEARRLYGMELHRAVGEGEFVLFYQPQVNLEDGLLTGAEALLRWRHPQRGLLSPAAFLPALEGGPLAAVVGFWVLEEACAQAARWRRLGVPRMRMGVNLFAAQFHVADLVEEVRRVLRRHDLPPEALELEVTENIVLDHDELMLRTLQGLRSLGVGIAFDDFGTGYASLGLLRSYPLTRLKIDRSFVNGMLASGRDAALVRSILDMASHFGLATVAEGVEKPSQREHLRMAGCSEGQGYLFGRPMPAAQFEDVFGIGPAPSLGRAA
ncbi:EAL domain-containing protein [Piscinibacter sakaiensis]|uniref:Sensory box/GGDEF family protein n=1 Tax=Piscinibacter sakaiensis TaxID=1547922 RepID=A0A0K8P803_PISS1|nr:EAL domain-containing protein [Piscinibacter sakaiensis]GAP38761.1 sensory box/GGDEF family protein [Piscinibacter sakaiensis]